MQALVSKFRPYNISRAKQLPIKIFGQNNGGPKAPRNSRFIIYYYYNNNRNRVIITDKNKHVQDTLYVLSDLRAKDNFPFKHSQVNIHKDRD